MKDKRTTAGQEQATPVNWSEVHRRLEAAQAAGERGWTLSLEEKKKILKTRAKALAQELERKTAAEEQVEVIEFLLAYERYGIELSYVREVYPLKELTPVPATPPFVLGITNVRGQILSVLDIKKFFDLPEKGLTDLNKVIIVRAAGMELGILADLISGVRSVPLREIQPSLPTLTGIRADYVGGVTKDRLVVLDVERMLFDERVVVHQQVEA